MLDFGGIWPNFHIQIFGTRLILSILKVNEKVFNLGPQVKTDHTNGKRINSYFIDLIFYFHYVSILIHRSFLQDYFVWHLYMFI
jgi:hypothetical protein